MGGPALLFLCTTRGQHGLLRVYDITRRDTGDRHLQACTRRSSRLHFKLLFNELDERLQVTHACLNVFIVLCSLLTGIDAKMEKDAGSPQ